MGWKTITNNNEGLITLIPLIQNEKLSFEKYYQQTKTNIPTLKIPNFINRKLNPLLNEKLITKKDIVGSGSGKHTEYYINYEGVFNYISKNICYHKEIKLSKISLIIFGCLFKQYILDIINYYEKPIKELTIKELFEGFIQGFESVTQDEIKDQIISFKRDYDIIKRSYLVGMENELIINLNLISSSYYFGDKPAIITKTQTKEHSEMIFIHYFRNKKFNEMVIEEIIGIFDIHKDYIIKEYLSNYEKHKQK